LSGLSDTRVARELTILIEGCATGNTFQFRVIQIGTTWDRPPFGRLFLFIHLRLLFNLQLCASGPPIDPPPEIDSRSPSVRSASLGVDSRAVSRSFGPCDALAVSVSFGHQSVFGNQRPFRLRSPDHRETTVVDFARSTHRGVVGKVTARWTNDVHPGNGRLEREMPDSQQTPVQHTPQEADLTDEELESLAGGRSAATPNEPQTCQVGP